MWDKYPRTCRKVGEVVCACIEKRRKYVDNTVMMMEVPGERTIGQPQRRWLNNIRNILSDIIRRGSALTD